MPRSELAGLVGIKHQAVYDIETGRYLPNTGVALAMAKVLVCRMEDMGAADGLLEPCRSRAKILLSKEQIASTALLLGCDPAFSILGHRVREAPGHANLNVRFASSQKTITRVALGQAHIAGTHMHGRDGEDGNKFLVTRKMKDISGVMIAFFSFREKTRACL